MLMVLGRSDLPATPLPCICAFTELLEWRSCLVGLKEAGKTPKTSLLFCLHVLSPPSQNGSAQSLTCELQLWFGHGCLCTMLSSSLELTPHGSSEGWCIPLQHTPHREEGVSSSRKGEEVGREGSQTSQTHVLGSEAVREEIAADEGCRGRQGWARLYHCSGLYSILSRFCAV